MNLSSCLKCKFDLELNDNIFQPRNRKSRNKVLNQSVDVGNHPNLLSKHFNLDMVGKKQMMESIEMAKKI